MTAAPHDEWTIIEGLLPSGWKAAAREQQAFRRVRYTSSPGALLRLLLFHAVNGSGLRETVVQAKAAGLESMSAVALFKRMKTSGPWLEWIAARLAGQFRERSRALESRRLRVIDSTSIQRPASTGTDWRLHYTIDLCTLSCDWQALTDAHGAELLERAPVERGDVLLADRNFLRPLGAHHVVAAGGDLVVRLRWTHSRLTDPTASRSGPSPRPAPCAWDRWAIGACGSPCGITHRSRDGSSRSACRRRWPGTPNVGCAGNPGANRNSSTTARWRRPTSS